MDLGCTIVVGFHDYCHATWVPARHLSQPSGPAVVEVEYDTTELPIRVGDRLVVVAEDTVSGWLWCQSESGREGWMPMRTLKPFHQ